MNDKTDPLAKLDEFATTVCEPETVAHFAELARQPRDVSNSFGDHYGDGVRMGFIAGFASRNYFRPGEFGIEGDMLEAVKGRHPEIFRALESLLEGDDDGLGEDDNII